MNFLSLRIVPLYILLAALSLLPFSIALASGCHDQRISRFTSDFDK
jgi:hypothetical protein